MNEDNTQFDIEVELIEAMFSKRELARLYNAQIKEIKELHAQIKELTERLKKQG